MKRVILTEDVDYTMDDVEILQHSLCEITASIHASSPFEKDLSSLIAQYLLYDFELSLDQTMIAYKSCEETAYYKIGNIFQKYRYPLFCSPSNITTCDVLVKLSTKNHIKNENYHNERFMIRAISVIAPDECTEPFRDCIVWVFNDDSDAFVGIDIANQRLDIDELEYDQRNQNERDQTKPVMNIHNPKISELTTQTLPYGIIGNYVLFKFMAQSLQSENVDVQYCGVSVCRL